MKLLNKTTHRTITGQYQYNEYFIEWDGLEVYIRFGKEGNVLDSSFKAGSVSENKLVEFCKGMHDY